MKKKLMLLNKTQAIVIFVIFLMISIFPAIQSLKIDNDGLRQVSETQDRIPILKQIGPVGTFEEYISSREDKPFFIEKISQNIGRGDSPLIIVFVEAEGPHLL